MSCELLLLLCSYLLQEAHPHKYMYYPAWGVSEEGCAALGEFLRRDKRMKVMTLAGNDIRDEGESCWSRVVNMWSTACSQQLQLSPLVRLSGVHVCAIQGAFKASHLLMLAIYAFTC
jgi:hypothetical protein